MSLISHIDHLVLTVRDIEQSCEFYERVLHLKPITFANGRRALKFGNQKINLQTLGQETRNHACIGSGDLCLITTMQPEDFLRHLEEQSVPVIEGPVEKSGAQGPIISIYFNDPDNNLIEVSSYRRD